MTRMVSYLPKNTAANTEYRDVCEGDHSWLLNQLMQYLVMMATLTTSKSEDNKIVIAEYWRKKRSNLPKGREGQNSPESMVAGIIENMLYATVPQKDFTAKQCTAIEDISHWMHAIDSVRFEKIMFQIKVL